MTGKKPTPRRRVTLHDVASVAGVSPITVSRALRQPDLLTPQTRKKIEGAVRATGYVPDLVARSFRSQRTGLVAAIVPSLTNSVYADTLQGISDGLRIQGLELMVGVSGFSLEQEEALVRAFIGRRPDGIILTGVDRSPATRRLLRASGAPIVETWTLSKSPIDMSVGFSDEAACLQMTEKIYELGYRKIGFICGPTTNNDKARQRLAGYRKACVNLGIASDLEIVLESQTELGGGRLGLIRLLDRDPTMDAVFCSSDVFAAGALFECQRRGWRVPDRLAIAGFQGLPLVEEVVPTLTTVRIPRYEIGRTAAAMILARISGRGEGPRQIDLGFTIVLGGST